VIDAPHRVGATRDDVPLPRAWFQVIFALALVVRVAAWFVHGRSLAFLKYPSAARLLAAGTLDGERLHDFSPLYLQVHRLFAAFGVDSLVPVVLLQCLLGALTVVFAAHLAARSLGARTGLLAGLFLSLQSDLVLYAQVLEPEPFLLFFTVLAVSLYGLGQPRRSLGVLAAAGLAAGLAAATRPTAWLVLVLLLAAEGAAFWRDRDRGRVAGAAALILVALLAQGVTARWTLPDSGGLAMSPWQVLYTGNNPQATGLWRHDFLVKDLEEQRSDGGPDWAHQAFRNVAAASGASEDDPDRYWRDQVLAFWRHYPGRALTLAGEKLLALGQHHDPDDIDTVFRLRRRLATWPLLPAWLLVGLGLAGLAVAGRGLCWFAALAGTQAATCALFFVSSRYRLPVLLWLAIPAAAWLALIASALQRGRSPTDRGRRLPRRILAGILAGALSLGLFAAPLPPGPGEARHIREIRDVHHIYAEAWRLHEDHDLRGASALLGDCLARVPWERGLFPIPEVPFPTRALATERLDAVRADAELSGASWDRLRLAALLELSGLDEEAVREYRVAAELCWRPSDRDMEYTAVVAWGRLLLRAGNAAAAAGIFRRAADLRPGAPRALLGLAMAAPESGALDDALLVNSRLEVLYLQGRLLLELGRPRGAVPPLEELAHALPGFARGRLLLATALSRTGQHPAAVRHALEAHEAAPNLLDPDFPFSEVFGRAAADPSAPQAVRRYAAWFAAREGRLDEAMAAWKRIEQRGELTPGSRGRIGVLLFRHGRAGQALPALEAAVAEDPADRVASEALAAARRRLDFRE